MVLRVQVDRGAGLFEAGPEHRRRDEQDRDHADAALLLRIQAAEQHHAAEEGRGDRDDADRGVLGQRHRIDHEPAQHGGDDNQRQRGGGEHQQQPITAAPQRPRGIHWLRRRRADATEPRQRRTVVGQAQQHEHAGGAEAPVPAHLLAQEAAEQLADEGAEVDAHVEDREAGIAVQRTDHRADVRLQQAGAERDQHQADEEAMQVVGHREREVAGRDQQPAVPDRALLADQPVGDPAAGQRGQIDAGRIEPVDRIGIVAVEPQAAGLRRRDHRQHQDRAHAVVAEALPHLGEEQRAQRDRMVLP